MDKFYFRCRSNPKGPLVVLDSEREAREMKTHPDYDPVDVDGLPIVVPEDGEVAERDQIPFTGNTPVKR